MNDSKKANKDISLAKELYNYFIQWSLNSTTHGIPMITRNKYIYLKIMWAIFFLVSTGLCVNLLLESLTEYLSFKVNTNVEVINDKDSYFPAVSICSLNPFNTFDPEIKRELEDALNGSKFNLSFVKSYYVPMLTVKSIAKYLKVYIANKTYEERKKYGYDLKAMTIDCLFNTSPCMKNSRVIKSDWFYHYEYGSCFKYTGFDDQQLRTTKNGYKGGLQLEIYIGNSSLNEAFTNKRGLRVLIHNNTDNFSDLEDQGIDVPAGFLTNIAVKRTYFERLDHPYSNCIKDLTMKNKYQTNTMKSMFENLNITLYSQQLCEKYRYSQHLLKQCGCVDVTFSFLNKKSSHFLETCNTPEKVICMETEFIRYYSRPKDDTTECPQECSYIQYDFEISQSNFMTEWYLDLIKYHFSLWNRTNPVSKSILPKLQNIMTLEEARKDIVALNIYYDKIDYTLISQTPLWNINTLLSNFGGQIGLFLGMSVLSLVEIIEIILIAFYVIWKRFMRRRNSLDEK